MSTGSFHLVHFAREWEFWEKNNNLKLCFGYALNPSGDWKCQQKETNYSSVEYSLCGGGIHQSITVCKCIVCTILSTIWWSGRFQTVSRGHALFLQTLIHNDSCEREAGRTDSRLWTSREGHSILIKHFAYITCVLPSPVGPAGRWPLNIHNLINLKFMQRLQRDAAYSGQSACMLSMATWLLMLLTRIHSMALQWIHVCNTGL